MISTQQPHTLCRHIRIAALAAVMLALGGCGDFFDRETTEIETRRTLDDLRRIQPLPEVYNTLPELYRKPPSRLEVDGRIRLFYFTRQQSVGEISQLITQQLGHKVTANAATNQLIIDVESHEQADMTLDFLEKVDVAPIQIKIDCLVLERFADVTMDWETKTLIEDLFGTGIRLSGKPIFDKDGDIIDHQVAFPGAAIREEKRRTFGLDLGYARGELGDDRFETLVDILVSRGYLKVLMNPTLETLNGQKATVRSRENVPISRIVSDHRPEPYSIIDYTWVEDRLEVTPHVYADGSIGLETNVIMGSKSKPEGVVQISVITEREIQLAENRVAPGESLVVGGIRKSEERSVIRGVPFLKDIPILGVLFSSKDFEEKATEVVFILTPTISSGGVNFEAMVHEVRQRFEPQREAPGLTERIFDPLGMGAYTRTVEEQAAQAEYERLKADLERAEAHEELGVLRQTLLQQAEQVMIEKQNVARARQELEQVRRRYEKLQAEAETAQAEAEAARQEARQAREQAQEAKRQAEQIQNEQDASEQERKQAAEQAAQAAQEAERARQEADKAAEEAAEAIQKLHEAEQQADELLSTENGSDQDNSD